MWRERFQDQLREWLTGQPGIARVEIHYMGKDQTLPNLKVIGTDGVEVWLLITRTSPQGGEDFAGEERIVTKADLAQVD